MWDSIKNAANNVVMGASKYIYDPPQTDQFEINGQLSPNEFKKAGDHLVEVKFGLIPRYARAGCGCRHLTPFSSQRIWTSRSNTSFIRRLCARRESGQP